MELTPLGIEGAWLAESPVWSDDRGFFREWFKSEDIEKASGKKFLIEQANISLSSRGTVRGIHYSTSPHFKSDPSCVPFRLSFSIIRNPSLKHFTSLH